MRARFTSAPPNAYLIGCRTAVSAFRGELPAVRLSNLLGHCGIDPSLPPTRGLMTQTRSYLHSLEAQC